VQDAGAVPAGSTNRGFDMERYTERDWQRLVGWGMCPPALLIESPADGAELASIVQQVDEQTTRESTDVISEKP